MVLGQAETVGAGWQHEEQFVERIRAVTRKDVQRVAQRYLVDETRTVGVLIPTPGQPSGPPTGPGQAPGASQ